MPFKIKSGHISAADCTRYPRTGRLFEALFMSAKKISEERPVLCPSLALTLWLFNIAIENGPFIVVLPIKNGDFPWLCWITNHMVNGPVMKWGLIEYDRIICYGRTFEHTIIVIVKSGCGPTPGFQPIFTGRIWSEDLHLDRWWATSCFTISQFTDQKQPRWTSTKSWKMPCPRSGVWSNVEHVIQWNACGIKILK